VQEVDIAIIGGGPAGLTAALYTSRARASTVVFDSGMTGGQIVTTEHVENYPGFPEGIAGPELGRLMLEQAQRFGAFVEAFNEIESVGLDGIDFVLKTMEDEEYRAKSLIIATGAVPTKLGVPGEAEFTGRGVSWCATCDGALFRDKIVAVIGGGDAAVEEAIFLTKFAREVHLVHRRDELRATKCIQERCFENDKIIVHWSRAVAEIVGENGKVSGIRLASTKADPDETVAVDGVFEFVGVDPKSDLVKHLVDCNEAGFIKTDHNGITSYPGIFAAGDVTDFELKQVVTAAGRGASAAFEALRYIDARLCTI